jgi:hypothetical protein
MTRYLISFDDGAMIFPEEDLPDVAKAAHEVVQKAQDAGVWVLGGGLESQRASVVATDGTVTDGPHPETKEILGGFAVVDVPAREEALVWAAKIAVACRCAQEARDFCPTRPSDRRRPATLGRLHGRYLVCRLKPAVLDPFELFSPGRDLVPYLFQLGCHIDEPASRREWHRPGVERLHPNDDFVSGGTDEIVRPLRRAEIRLVQPRGSP